MGKAGENNNCPELNCHEGQGLSKEGDQQRSEQQLQGPSVSWEEFLSVKSLKVLLVESDEETRNLVGSLLRNCAYEVIAVASGVQAWDILKDVTTHVDLVLSEVDVPCLSGIDLLTKIMDHKTCKNIPVIMMSKYDSMGTVHKCLSKGAADFLVKPIRKNELKTLWQHVWRKCHSQSSGSGNGSGVWTQNSTKSTSAEDSDKNTGSNYEDSIGNYGPNARNEGDDGSGTEESRGGNDEFPKHSLDLSFQITQATRSRTEPFDNDGVPAIKSSECEGQHEGHDVVMGKDSGIGVPRIPYLQLEKPKEKGLTLTDMAGTNKDNEQLQKGQPELNNENLNRELRNQAVDLMGVTTTNSTDPQMQTVMFDIRNSVSKIPDIKDRAIHDNEEILSLELSLKTERDVRDTRFSDHDQSVLRHSNYSAFSRYKFPTTSKQAPSGNLSTYYPLDNSSEAAQARSLQQFQSNSNPNNTPLYHHSHGSSNDMGSTTNHLFANEMACEDKEEPRSTLKCLYPSYAYQPVHNRIVSLSQPIIQGKADAAICDTTSSQGSDMNQQVQVERQQQHHHHMRNMPHQQITSPQDFSLKNLAAGAPQCGSSNVQGALMEGNADNHSLHRSASGSNDSSNGKSGDSSAINYGGTNLEYDKGVVGQEGTIGEIGVGSESGVDQNHRAIREATLNKFRQKRKERCFEKKVRYHHRKKLAEQRLRVRGQFVRQEVQENKGNDTDDS